MGGEKSKINKAETLFFFLKIREDFNETVRWFRLQFAVPKNGFNNIENINKWIRAREYRLDVLEKDRKSKKSSSTQLELLGYNLGLGEILKIYNLPPTSEFRNLLEEYILGGDKFQMIRKRSENVVCMLEIPTEKEIGKNGKPFIKIRVYNTATSHEDVANFIKESWPTIQFFLGNKNHRINAIKNKDLIKHIFNLYRLPMDTLYTWANIDKSNKRHISSKSTLITKILMPKGKDNKDVKKIIKLYKGK